MQTPLPSPYKGTRSRRFSWCNLLELFAVSCSGGAACMRPAQCLGNVKRSCTRLSNTRPGLLGALVQVLSNSKPRTPNFSAWQVLICSVGLRHGQK